MTRYPHYDSELRQGESDEEWLQLCIARHMQSAHDDPLNAKSIEGIDYYVVDDSELPDNKDFDAWEWRDGKVQVNQSKLNRA